MVEGVELLKKSREVAEAILKNKSAINDGLKLDLGQALALEKVIAFPKLLIIEP